MAIPNETITLDDVRKGFINGVFKHPSLIVTHFHKLFCDAEITLSDVTDNSLVITCVSLDWCKNKYTRRFHIMFIKRDDDVKRITNIEEI